MNPLKSIYRAVTPSRFREYLAGQRYHLEAWLHDPRLRHETAAKWWIRTRCLIRPARTKYGVVYVNLLDPFVGRVIYRDRAYEPAETQFLENTLRSGMTYLDVGANVGYFVAVAAGLVGETGKVAGIEPEPFNFQLLSRTVVANHWKNVTVFPMAAGAEAGEAQFFKSAENLGDHRLYTDEQTAKRSAVKVPVERLDTLFQKNGFAAPDLIKIDVQGFEVFVARGMAGFLAGDRPLIVTTEFWPHGMKNAGSDPQEYLDTFRTHGFICHRLTEDG